VGSLRPADTGSFVVSSGTYPDGTAIGAVCVCVCVCACVWWRQQELQMFECGQCYFSSGGTGERMGWLGQSSLCSRAISGSSLHFTSRDSRYARRLLLQACHTEMLLLCTAQPFDSNLTWRVLWPLSGLAALLPLRSFLNARLLQVISSEWLSLTLAHSPLLLLLYLART